jgi:predicted acyl esterase
MVRSRSLSLALVAVLLLAGCIQAGLDETLTDDAPKPRVTRVGGGAPDETATAVFPGTYDMTGRFSRVLEQGPLGILPAERVTIPSEVDGVDILMGVHRPDTDEPVPVFVLASPYFGFLGDGADVTERVGAFGNLVENFVPHGFAVVGLAVRGTGGSGGCNDLMGPMETQDLDTAITWLGTQDWSNGNVGMTGVSYDGSTPWGVASTGNKHLKTIVPISGVPNLYELMYRNGSAEARGPAVLNALYYAGNIISPTATPEQMAERTLCPDAVIGIGWSAFTGATGMHDRQQYWELRNRKPHVEEYYQGSIFSVQGLQDWNVNPSQVVPWVDQLDQHGIRTKQLLGQWGHAWPDTLGEDGEWAADYRADYNELLLRWLEQELKGIEQDTGAPVQVRDHLGRWRNEAHYPPRDATWTNLHLSGGELLEEPSGRESIRLFPEAVLPLDGEVVHNHAEFTYGPFDDELLVVGVPKLHIAVTPDGPGGYIGAYLYEETAAGDRARIGWTSIDLAFADGSEDYTPVIPQETLQALLQFEPMDAVIREGSTLVLRVWMVTDEARIPSVPPTPVTLELGANIPSVLKLSTVERDEDVYFEVPTPENPTVSG